MGIGLVTVGALLQGFIPDAVLTLVLGLLAIPLILWEFRVVRFPLPQNRRLVPENVFRFGPVIGPFQFGIEMGTGMRTFAPSALPHLLVLFVVLAMTALLGLVAALGFGTGRALMGMSSVLSGDPGRWDAAWRRTTTFARLVLTPIYVLVAVTLILGQ